MMGMDGEAPPPPPSPDAGKQPSTAPKLAMVLRSLIGAADEKNTGLYLHFNKITDENKKEGAMNIDLNKAMRNAGGENFDYGAFKASYDTDPRIKTMVANFDQHGIEGKTAKTIDDKGGEEAATDADPNGVEQLAKQATDIGSLGSNV